MITTLTGSNGYALDEQLKELVESFAAEHGQSIERFDGAELSSADPVIDAVRSVSFLEPKKLVILRSVQGNAELLEKMQDIVEQTADSTDLVVYDPALDKRTSAYKFLSKATDMKQIDEQDARSLATWAVKEAKNLGVTLTPSDASYLLDRTGLNQQLLARELEKLALLGGAIDRQRIDDLVEPTPQSKVFDLLERLFSGDFEKTLELYKDQRAQGEEPQKIIAMITWQLQQLTLAVFSPQKTVDALVGEGMNPYSARKVLQLARNITPSQLRHYITLLVEIDAQSKTNADVESALAVYFADVAVTSSS